MDSRDQDRKNTAKKRRRNQLDDLDQPNPRPENEQE